jgi:hypothetical protein
MQSLDLQKWKPKSSELAPAPGSVCWSRIGSFQELSAVLNDFSIDKLAGWM